MQADLPPDAPAVDTILADLAANDTQMATFSATGTFSLKAPELKSIEQFRQSSVLFQRPDALNVVGRRYAKAVFELTCAHPAFLIGFPTEREFLYRPEGATLRNQELAISPADLAREMFFPEVWTEMPPERVRMLSYDAATQRAQLAVYEKFRSRTPQRLLDVEGGTHWVIVRNERLDASGNTLAVTERTDYREEQGVRYAAAITTHFPQQDAFMTFTMKRITLNEPVKAAEFDVHAKAAALERSGWAPINPNETGYEQ
ncbi:MAG: hypothetical protein HYZ36_08355 [Pedosphaera parvula]|nr:hypothetical protein [Pedosphaera parvula]